MYFQRSDSPFNPNYAKFGYKFIIDRKDLIGGLEKAIKRCLSHYSPLVLSASSESAGADFQLNSMLYRMFSAFSHWLSDSRLNNSEVALNLYPEVYEVDRLSSCFDGGCISPSSKAPWSGLWLDLVPLGSIPFSIDFNPSSKLTSNDTVRNRTEMELPPPDAAETFTLRSPVVQHFASLDIEQVKSILGISKPKSSSDLKSLLSKAQTFQMHFQRHGALNEDYLSNLPSLYQTRMKRGRFEKKCSSIIKSSSCVGGAVFEYRYKEALFHSDVQLYLTSNRSEADSLMIGEHIDQVTCVNSLKIINACDWIRKIAEDGSESLTFQDVRELALAVFYNVINVVEEEWLAENTVAKSQSIFGSLEDYPPLKMILETLLGQLGESFVSNSPREVWKLYTILMGNIRWAKLWDIAKVPSATSRILPIILAKLFSPNLVGEDRASSFTKSIFCEMYSGISDNWYYLGEGVWSVLLDSFDVEKWLKDKRSDALLNLQLLGTILDAIQKIHLDSSNENRKILDHHLNILLRFLFAVRDNYFIDVFEVMLNRCSRGVLPTRVLALPIYPMIFSGISDVDYDFNFRSYLENATQFLPSFLSYSKFSQVISKIRHDFLDVTNKELNVETIHIYFPEILNICLVIFTSQPLHMMISEIHIAESWSILSNLLLSWMELCDFLLSHTDNSSAIFVKELSPFLDDILEIFQLIVTKLCKFWAVPERSVFFLWELYGKFLEMNSRTSLIMDHVHSSFRSKPDVWEKFVFNKAVVAQIAAWVDSLDGGITFEIKKHLCWIITVADLDVPNLCVNNPPDHQGGKTAAFCLLRILYAFVINSNDIFLNQAEDRARFFSALRSKVFIIDWSLRLRLLEYKQLLRELPESWQENEIDDIVNDSGGSSSLGLILHFSRELAGIFETDSAEMIHHDTTFHRNLVEGREKVCVYLEFLLRLVEEQVTKGSDVKNFKIDSLGHIVHQILELSNKLVENVYTEKIYAKIINCLNVCEPSSVYGKIIWNSIVEFASKKCNSASSFIKSVCEHVSSIEQMTLLIEGSISFYFFPILELL